MVWFFIFGSSCPVSLLCHLSRIVLVCRLLLRFGASRKSPLHQMSALRQERSIKNGHLIEIRKYFIAIILRST
jgi:hypothetical protein